MLCKSLFNYDVLSQDVFIFYVTLFARAHIYFFECTIEIYSKTYVLFNGFIGDNAQIPFYCLDFVSLLCRLALFGEYA
jgi:hypothetical protein